MYREIPPTGPIPTNPHTQNKTKSKPQSRVIHDSPHLRPFHNAQPRRRPQRHLHPRSQRQRSHHNPLFPMPNPQRLNPRPNTTTTTWDANHRTIHRDPSRRLRNIFQRTVRPQSPNSSFAAIAPPRSTTSNAPTWFIFRRRRHLGIHRRRRVRAP